MKQIIYFSLLLIGCSQIIAATGPEKTKTVSKSYPANQYTTLEISNSYGDIHVSTWEKNEVSIVVEISVEGKNESKVEKGIERISIKFSEKGDVINAKTEFEGFSKGGVKMEINYYIKMPDSYNFKLHLNYGDLFLPVITGWAKLNANYATLNMNKAKSFDVSTNYSDVYITESQDIKASFNYGDVFVSQAHDIKASFNYGELHCNSVTLKGKFSFNYSDLLISNIEKTFELIDISENYSDSKIIVDKNTPFKLNMTGVYSDIELPSTLNISYKKKSNNSLKVVASTHDNATGEINISSTYSDVELQIK